MRCFVVPDSGPRWVGLPQSALGEGGSRHHPNFKFPELTNPRFDGALIALKSCGDAGRC